MVAMNNGVLHGDTIDQARVGNAMGKQISLSEKNTVINGVGDMPNTTTSLPARGRMERRSPTAWITPA
jgi:hypothetical protein